MNIKSSPSIMNTKPMVDTILSLLKWSFSFGLYLMSSSSRGICISSSLSSLSPMSGHAAMPFSSYGATSRSSITDAFFSGSYRTWTLVVEALGVRKGFVGWSAASGVVVPAACTPNRGVPDRSLEKELRLLLSEKGL